jgi:hypothetical protein
MPFAEADETAVIVDDRCPAGGMNGRHLADVARENRSNPARCSSPPLPRMLLNYGQFEPDISSRLLWNLWLRGFAIGQVRGPGPMEHYY